MLYTFFFSIYCSISLLFFLSIFEEALANENVNACSTDYASTAGSLILFLQPNCLIPKTDKDKST